MTLPIIYMVGESEHRKELTRYAQMKDVLWHIAQMTIPYTTFWHQYKDIG